MLERLAGEGAPIANKVLEWRQLAKLKIAPIPMRCKPRSIPQTGRVHTSYSLVGAQTGRLSSTDPNLQNIPIRTEIGRQIREAFVAEPGNVLLAADYSQIELRLAAHMADVPELKEAFAQGEDIHARTAEEMFGHVDRDTRARAKTINFAILYGITRWGLGGRLGVPPDEAQAMIDRYFERFPGIQQLYPRHARDRAGARLFGDPVRPQDLVPADQFAQRRPNAPAANAPRSTHRSRAPAPISSSARWSGWCPRWIEAGLGHVRMLLQVHDELVFELPEGRCRSRGAGDRTRDGRGGRPGGEARRAARHRDRHGPQLGCCALNRPSEGRRIAGIPLVNLTLFTLVGLALIGLVVLIFNTIEAERETREQARETSEILLELRNIGRIAVNAETGQRGYYITLDQRYLDPYRIAREQYQPAIERLRGLVGNDPTPRQAQLLADIERRSKEKFAELDKSVTQISRGELIAAQRQILTDQGQETMTRLRRSLTEMELIENRILAQASENTAAVEARVLPMLAGLMVLLLAAIGLGYWQVARAARAAALELHAQELSEAHDQAELLARELNHRVKNLFAVILAIVRMSGKSDPRAKDVVENIAQRIHALLTAHEVTQGTLGNQQADLRQLVETTLAPHDGSHVELELAGPSVALPARQVTPLGLVFHELATNAVKYGAWSQGGKIDVNWTVGESEIVLQWSEHCPSGCPTAGHKGFGTQLIDSAARQLQGRIERDFTDNGVHVTIAFPAVRN